MEQQQVKIGGGLEGWYAMPAGDGRFPAVIVLMEAFGLTQHIRRVCERLAAAGFCALAPDLYHGRQYAYDTLDLAVAALKALKDDSVMDEIGTSLDWLAARGEVDAARLAVQGYCMGGRLAFLAGCRHAGRLRATVSFYGGGIFPEGPADRLGRRPPVNDAAALAAPLLLIYGSADQSIAPAEHARLAQRLGELQKRYTLSLYPGVQHGFCCEDREAYAPQAARAAQDEAVAFLSKAMAG